MSDGYCQAEDVQRLIKWIHFTMVSKVKLEDIEQFIKEVDSYIDSRISRIYEVPVTHETDMVILGYASARLAAYEAAKILIAQAGGDLPAIVEQWKISAEERINSILSGEVILGNTDRRRPASGLYSHTAHDPDAPKRQWEVGKEQW